MLQDKDIEKAIDRYGDVVWRACLLYFRSDPDAEDAFQETFLKFALNTKPFNDDEHVKAWLIRVATNTCKDMLKAAERKNISASDVTEELLYHQEDQREQPSSSLQEILDAMRELGDPPKTALYLAMYEGYTAPEIAKMLDTPTNTIYSWISRGKQQLREALSWTN